MKYYEYKLVRIATLSSVAPELVERAEGSMTRMGADGWELVGVTSGASGNSVMAFKREMPEEMAKGIREGKMKPQDNGGPELV